MGLRVGRLKKGGRCWGRSNHPQTMRRVAALAPVAPPDSPILGAIGRLSDRRRATQTVGRALGRNPMTADIAQRIGNCAGRLALAIELQDDAQARALITGGHFCQARLCSFCEWRRTRAWRGRLISGLGRFAEAFPTHKAVFLTLTVRNCPIHETGATIKHLHSSFARMVRTSWWPTPFYLRRTEVTLGKPSFADDLPNAPAAPMQTASDVPGCLPERDGAPAGATRSSGASAAPAASLYGLWAHPHLHALLMVPAGYFGPGYIRQGQWQQNWAAALGVDYAPVIDVRRATSKAGSPVLADAAQDAVMEAAKYISKANDISKLGAHAAELHQQLKGQRMIQLSHRLSKFIKAGEIEAEEMLDLDTVNASQNPMFHTVVQWDSLLSEYKIAP